MATKGGVPGFEFVPPEVLGREVYKSFVHGYLKVFQAIDIILQERLAHTHQIFYYDKKKWWVWIRQDGRDLPTPTNFLFYYNIFHMYI